MQVRIVYEKFGLTYTPEFEGAMALYQKEDAEKRDELNWQVALRGPSPLWRSMNWIQRRSTVVS